MRQARYLTASFTGLRLGELLALRWEDVDFEADTVRVRRDWTAGGEGTPKSGRGRAVPMIADVAEALARLGQRERFTGDQDLVFCDPLGRHVGYKSVSQRYMDALSKAELRQLSFHETPLPRPATHVRHTRDPPRRPARGHGVGGPCGLGNDAEVPGVSRGGTQRDG